MTLCSAYDVITLLLYILIGSFLQGLIQKLSLPWSHSWLCFRFIIFFEFHFYFMCTTSKNLKWLNLHCCHLCAYLIYPISLKLLTEQKRGLSIIVSPNVYVDEWINKWMNIQSFKKIKVDRWIRRARTFHWGFHHSALRTQWRKNVSYSHICPWS